MGLYKSLKEVQRIVFKLGGISLMALYIYPMFLDLHDLSKEFKIRRVLQLSYGIVFFLNSENDTSKHLKRQRRKTKRSCKNWKLVKLLVWKNCVEELRRKEESVYAFPTATAQLPCKVRKGHSFSFVYFLELPFPPSYRSIYNWNPENISRKRSRGENKSYVYNVFADFPSAS